MFENPQQKTPPPDNFAHIQPCSHLENVLQTKVRLTVLATYRQAVAISIAINPVLAGHVVFKSKKDDAPVPIKKVADYKNKTLRCNECSTLNFYSVFICLQCPHVGCYDHHGKKHAKEANHLFAIDSSNGLLFCFSCGNYINHSQLNEIRLSAVAACLGSDVPAIHHEPQDNDLIPMSYSKPSNHAVHGLRGIINLGATCFMSCILQTLLHNPLVKYHFFNNDVHFFECPSAEKYLSGSHSNLDYSSACITCLVDSIFKHVYAATSNDGFGITNLLQTAWYKNSLLAGFSEQDAHEFWQFLLNEFHSDYENVASSAGIPLDPENCPCITHSTFSGQLESSVVCDSCGSRTNTIDPLMDVSLEVDHLNPNSNLYTCLDKFTHSESLDVTYKCQSCTKPTTAKKTLRLKKIPPVLSIQLKRFKHNSLNDTASKIETPVETPLYLNLTKYASDYEDNEQRQEIDTNKVYELFAVVTHIGSVNTGHYIALIKNSSGQWFKFDDSVITAISHHDVTATNAYILFYIAHNI